MIHNLALYFFKKYMLYVHERLRVSLLHYVTLHSSIAYNIVHFVDVKLQFVFEPRNMQDDVSRQNEIQM